MNIMTEELIERPTKPGYVFSHWSINKPGSKTLVTDKDGHEFEIENDCAPFDFSKEVITTDTKLYAIFIPEVKVDFVTVDDNNNEEIVATQHTVYGGKAFDPTPNGVRSLVEEGLAAEVSSSHNQHKAVPINKNTGKPRIHF